MFATFRVRDPQLICLHHSALPAIRYQHVFQNSRCGDFRLLPPPKYDGQFPCRPQLNLGLTQLAHTPGVESEKYFLELDIEIEIIVGPP